MSASSDVPAVDLRWVDRQRLLRRPWNYIRIAGPFFAALMILKVVGGSGWLSSINLPVIHQRAVVRIMLSTNSVILDQARGGVSLWLFMLIIACRAPLGDTLNYYFAQRSAAFVRKEARSRFWRWVATLVSRIEGSRHWVILVSVGCVTFATAWIPIPVPLNLYWVAGVARVKIRWVLGVDIAVRLVFALLIHRYGLPWDAALRAV